MRDRKRTIEKRERVTMKRTLITVGEIVLLSLLALQAVQSNDSKGNVRAASSSKTALPRTPLTASEIAGAWPNLPSAKELYDSGSCLIIDLRYAGKQSKLAYGLPDELPGELPDPNSPAVYDMSSEIANYTSDDPIIDLGVIVHNNPHIWLEYNSSIWVQVPSSYLQTFVQPYATAVQQILNAHLHSTSQPGNQTTWAVGEYDDPRDISGSNPITGAISYGEWTRDFLPADDDPDVYAAVDVLSILTSDGYFLQSGMMLEYQWGEHPKSIAVDVWRNNTPWYEYWYTPWVSPPNLTVMYNLYMRKTGNYWNFYWNNTLFHQLQDAGTSTIVVGNQSNACVESNQFNQGNWTNFYTFIGDVQDSTIPFYCLPAIGFYYSNRWHPIWTGDTCPAAYAYNASAGLAGWEPWPGGVGNHEPPVWGTKSIGVVGSSREVFEVFYAKNTSSFSHQGALLWSKGPWSP